VLLWAGVIYGLSAVPHLQSGLEYDFLLRKIAHMVEYGVLAALLWRALADRPSRGLGMLFLFSFLISVVYAASDEWHQSFVPGRGASARDVAIDGAGALAACLILRRRRKKRPEAGIPGG
jgi:VanZ family protein